MRKLLLITVTVLLSISQLLSNDIPDNIVRTLDSLSKNDCKIYKTSIYTACYSTAYNRVLYTTYKVTPKSKLNNIKNRPKYYNNPKINVVKNKDYSDVKEYDRGHLAFHAAFDYSEESLYPLYDLELNIVPMLRNVNRIHNRHIEKVILNNANSEEVTVVTILVPSSKVLNNGHSNIPGNINIPGKIITAVSVKGSTRCYILDNIFDEYNNKPYLMDCMDIDYLKVL